MTLRPIAAVAEELGISQEHVYPWGRHAAKLSLDALRAGEPQGRLVLVSGLSPTPAGEGKTTTSVALAMGMRRRQRRAVVALRQPSQGPVFGAKGGGTGGGRASLAPAQDINLHFTGDIHAIGAAHNLLAALVDNAIHFRHPVEIDSRNVRWTRALDVNDRSLRNVMVGLGGKGNGVPREARFDITAASEVMAILCLATDLQDLEQRLGRIVVGVTRDGKPVRAADLHAAAAMTALLRDALLPNLAQTLEGGPALVHGGPFANIAHGCSSLVATRMALAHGQDVITEAGFGFDLGGEKFLDIKCRAAGLWPHAVVMVATLRALKFHGGASIAQVESRQPDALLRGFDNLQKHLESVAHFGLPALIALNRFPSDGADEIDELRAFARERGLELAVNDGYAQGGDGALELADKTLALLARVDENKHEPRYCYAVDQGMAEKIRAIATHVYGARDVRFTPRALEDLVAIEAMEGNRLPVCMAKTHLSLSDDPTRTGRPRDFTITVREVRLSAGAGFVVALTGDILTMPGLPREPAVKRVVVHSDGRVTGLMQGD